MSLGSPVEDFGFSSDKKPIKVFRAGKQSDRLALQKTLEVPLGGNEEQEQEARALGDCHGSPSGLTLTFCT